jgi:hypothetical protein
MYIFWKYFARQIYSCCFHISKPNNIKVIPDLCFQRLTQIFSKQLHLPNRREYLVIWIAIQNRGVCKCDSFILHHFPKIYDRIEILQNYSTTTISHGVWAQPPHDTAVGGATMFQPSCGMTFVNSAPTRYYSASNRRTPVKIIFIWKLYLRRDILPPSPNIRPWRVQTQGITVRGNDFNTPHFTLPTNSPPTHQPHSILSYPSRTLYFGTKFEPSKTLYFGTEGV